ncbi:endo-1,3-beta glucanase [Elasticomyces elasticus]|uniref:glucan endo-1,3-beta-D-glucosidase n=1 Tax=Exophiala sideris TaxID=1016849 RepID=A0ABR0JT14_9EURO|nr:endo-1,3-beta glucanase [Elasticomyces elasticus]KAK5040186.1 endo-1,3-beta glucanase [Exophiala sideris]KAK5043388.1 endo-1,3-beta glucanase [Exophiala sideris]KAK5068564.1 endo-1,3-beta glucanase [Exophiala sideris]KAK5186162.1 endo-1,3-beta glucanase [Eurotiomycetes sp. CCFEE 6388]
MYNIWCPILLTVSQAFLAGALHTPRIFGVNGQSYEVGPPITANANAQSYSSTITFVDPHLSIQTVTVTSLPASQTAATSFDNQTSTQTGTIISSLETGGNPASLPFPTSLPTVTSATIQPLSSDVPFGTETATGPLSTITETITLPLTTFETVIVTQTVTTVPVETTAVTTATTVLNTTATINGTEVTTSIAGTTVLTTTGTALVETTLSAATTVTATAATTLTTGGSLSNLPTATASCLLSMGCSGQDVFEPIAITSPPSNIEQQGGHPVPRLGIQNTTGPIETNKFYQNFVLDTQEFPAFVMPYSLTWSQGSGNAQSYGMAISHIEDSQKSYGPAETDIPNSPDQYYINPLGIQSLILSAAEFGTSTVLTTDSLLVFSANVHLQASNGSSSILSMPLVQGMAFVTGQYVNLQPNIQSSVFFGSVTEAAQPKAGVFKYRITLLDGHVWLLYAIPTSGVDPNFQLISSTLLQGSANWYGDIQLAKLPDDSMEYLYDDAAGTYPTSGTVTGYAQDSKAQYSLSWTKGGAYSSNSTLLMFALPHHLESFDSNTAASVTNLTLATTTSGNSTAIIADYWVLEENELPTSLGFAPWRPANSSDSTVNLTSEAIAAIQKVSATEASQNMSAQTNLNSMYYSGKALSKFAQLVYTMHDLADQEDLAKTALLELESCFEVFSNNQQIYPLLYDTDWKGLVSSASYVTGNSGDDFGNSYYNDHHFHYGYFLHAAAVIGYLDPTWLTNNKDYVNALARDVSNPSSLDQYFPVFRSFDWYHGHSWAKGLFSSGDGKDEESSSEDAMFAYGLKMWGQTIGDASMEARGNLMLSVLARSLQSYFLMTSDNTNQPAEFIGNKVTGILFENKVDHTTYFGTDLSYIQGIHMIPVMPFSTLTRTQQFVAEEWTTYFADGAVRDATNITGGWKGIVYANFANINPTAAYDFFTQDDFDMSWIDGGASLTWYIALSAVLGGAPS